LAAGAGVVVAETLVQSRPALAGTDGDVVLGHVNNETNTTSIFNSTSGDDALLAVAAGAGSGLSASSDAGSAVYGQGGSIGLEGVGAIGGPGQGVKGEVFGAPTSNGVYGHADNPDGSGVYGQNDGAGFGVAGRAVKDGTGVLADSANGTALKVSGRAKFSTSGTAVIASGQQTVTITLAGVTTSDFVLATVQSSGAFFVKNASAGSGQFTININKAPTAPATVKVAYFVISAS
jgi:hypothetical protein